MNYHGSSVNFIVALYFTVAFVLCVFLGRRETVYVLIYVSIICALMSVVITHNERTDVVVAAPARERPRKRDAHNDADPDDENELIV